MKTAICESCGNEFLYKTINNSIKCRKCNSDVPVEPDSIEDLNKEVEEGVEDE